MPWWGILLTVLGGLIGLWIIFSIILFAAVGFNFWRSWKDLF
jgi:hypothetical protein